MSTERGADDPGIDIENRFAGDEKQIEDAVLLTMRSWRPPVHSVLVSATRAFRRPQETLAAPSSSLSLISLVVNKSSGSGGTGRLQMAEAEERSRPCDIEQKRPAPFHRTRECLASGIYEGLGGVTHLSGRLVGDHGCIVDRLDE